MKKRLMSLLLVLVMVLSLLPTFAAAEETTRGVYAVGTSDSATYTFMVGTESVSTQCVAAGGTLIEPAAPEVSADQVFEGWYVGDTKLDFDDNGNLTVNSASDDVTVQARIVDVWRVTFKDVNDEKVVTVKSVPKGEAVDLTAIRYSVGSQDGNTAVVGWSETKNGEALQSPYTPSADVPLYPVVKSGNWLKFNENDDGASGLAGASYTPSQFLISGQSPTEPTAPTRRGYTFGGWYTDATCTTEYDFSPISAPTTVYAKWIPGNANYTVVVWKQRVTDTVGGEKHWDYEVSVPYTANVGDSVSVDNVFTTFGKHTVTIAGKNYDFIGFQFDHCDSAKTVAADGSTVLNVYYARRVITITYYPGSATVDHWITPDDSYYLPLNGHESSYDTSDKRNYNGKTYSAKVSYQGLYGAELKDEFPTEVLHHSKWLWINNDEIISNIGWRESDGTTLTFLGNFIPPTKTNDTITLDLLKSTNTNCSVYFYRQNVDGNGWTLARKVDMESGTFYITDKFQGFEAYKYRLNSSTDPGNESTWGTLTYNASNENYGSVSVGSGNILHIFFKRISYNIDFQYPNGTPAKPSVQKVYQAPLTGISEDAPAYPSDQPESRYEFVGWFADPQLRTYVSFQEISDAKKQELQEQYGIGSFVSYAGQTMPTNNIVLYAGFFERGFDCALDANEGTFADSQAGVFWTPRMSQIDSTISENVTREGYTIAGWNVSTVDGALKDVYREGPNNLRRVHDFSNWTISEELYDFANELTDPVYLTAKWLSNATLTVAYDLNGGTGDILDENQYFDGAEVAVKSAAPVKEGYQFIGWKVEGDESGLVLPGGALELNKANQDTDNDNAIKLTAVYNKMPSVTLTFDLNVESGSVNPTSVTLVKNAPYDLSNVTATSTERTLLGWSKTADGSVDFQTNTVVATDCDATLYAVWQKIENYNYVIDFNAAMTVAEQTSELRNADANDVLQGSNGKFVKAGTDVTYQLATGTQHTEANGTTVVNTAYSAADTAIVKGVPVRSGITTPTVSKITTIPASSIYFDDDLANETVPVGDGSGKNTQIGATPTEDDLAVGKHTYTFCGTGIDVYCTTYKTMNGQNVGTISAKLVKDGKTLYENMYNYSPEIRYNVPTVFFHDLPLGEYTLTLTALSGSHYKLDGIRVYNAVANQALYNETKDEQYAAYVNLRDALVNNPDSNIETYTVNGSLDAADLTQGTGVLFMDNPEYLTETVPEIDMKTGEEVKDENGKTKMVQVYTDTFTAYKDLGPKNEIYLSSGQAITFTLTDTAKAGKLWIGLSAPETGKTTGEVLVNNDEENPITVTSAMDMYYPVTKNDTGSYTIKNNGTNLIAITNLKITGVESIYNVAKAGQQTTQGNEQTGNSSAASFAVEDVVNMVFEPVTLRTVKLAANNGVDPDAVVTPDPEPDPEPGQDPEQPDTPDQPDDPKPGWNDDAYNPINILRTFFKLLLQNLGSLFSGLGNW